MRLDAFIAARRERPPVAPHRRVRVAADDRETLVCGLFEPQEPARDVLVFLHGVGANMGCGYLDFGLSLHGANGCAVWLPDLRGHGRSGGPRGHAAEAAQLHRDLDAVLAAARARHPQARLWLGGHSAGAALCLNRMTAPTPPAVAGLILLAPYLGAGVQRRRPAEGQALAFDGFSRTDPALMLAHLASGGAAHRDSIVVRFDYPEEAVRMTGLVTGYTPQMALALTPRAAAAQLAALPCPATVIAAEEDELFCPDAIAAATPPSARFRRAPDGHLSCLFTAHAAVAAAMLGES